MCAKPDEYAVYQPVAELHEEIIATASSNLLPELAWAGARTFYALLENV